MEERLIEQDGKVIFFFVRTLHLLGAEDKIDVVIVVACFFLLDH